MKILGRLDLIVALGVAFLAFSGNLHGEDENLFLVGLVWFLCLGLLGLLLINFKVVGKAVPLVLTILLPLFVAVAAAFSGPVPNFWSGLNLGDVVIILFYTGNFLWLLWLINLFLIIRKNSYK